MIIVSCGLARHLVVVVDDDHLRLLWWSGNQDYPYGHDDLDDCDDENCDDHDSDDDSDDDDKDDLEHGDEVPPPVGEGGQGAKIDSSKQSRHKPLSEEGGRIINIICLNDKN